MLEKYCSFAPPYFIYFSLYIRQKSLEVYCTFLKKIFSAYVMGDSLHLSPTDTTRVPPLDLAPVSRLKSLESTQISIIFPRIFRTDRYDAAPSSKHFSGLCLAYRGDFSPQTPSFVESKKSILRMKAGDRLRVSAGNTVKPGFHSNERNAHKALRIKKSTQAK